MEDLYKYNMELIEGRYIADKKALCEYRYLFKIIEGVEEKIKQNFTTRVSSDMTIPVGISVHMAANDKVSDIPFLMEWLSEFLGNDFCLSERVIMHGDIIYHYTNKPHKNLFYIYFYPSSETRVCEYVESGKFEPIMEWRCVDKEVNQ